MRLPLATIALLSALLPVSACKRDPEPGCAEAYDHMIALAKHEPEPDQREAFMRACVDAWDEERHDCLMAATTPDEALACRSQRANNR
ncbi:MAG: hypothetical protein H6744_06735 [Deltaproteobacteria bacterium]|nr:hypothetical protein [Deltaproteobacteria bacterium]MCB9786376.1 hypothetical protein [Deltaproteobacteria bacterium]